MPLSFTGAELFQSVNSKSWVKSITLATVFIPVGLSERVGALLVAIVGVVILVGLCIRSPQANLCPCQGY